MNQELAQKGHPKGLYSLFFTEMWERFSYYGMRALLVLYLTDKLINNGFEMIRSDALEIYAIFTGLVYLTPVLGGLLADKVLGQRKAIIIGAVIMALGQFGIALSEYGDISARSWWLDFGLALLILGNGFFKPNISTIVGSLYASNDPRRDSAFTIFYMGINLGAFLSPLICGTLGQKVDWFWGFTAAGVGMLLGLFWFLVRGNTLGDSGFPPNRRNNAGKLLFRDWMDVLLYTIASVFLVLGFLWLWPKIDSSVQTVVLYCLFALIFIAFLVIVFMNTNGSVQWSRVGVIFILAIFTIFFWSGFEQAGGTFSLFAEHNTDRTLFGQESWIEASWFQSINAIAIFALAPVFSWLWMLLNRLKINPSTPAKFGFGLILLGLGFVVMMIANGRSENGIMVSPLWLVSVYLLHTFGELCLSPIGLSMVTKLSPPGIVSLMMGFWFGCTALANYLAGMMESILHRLDGYFFTHFDIHLELFPYLACQGIVSGLFLLLISRILKKMMRGID